MNAVDLIVETENPDLLDRTVQSLGAAAVVEGSYSRTTRLCRVRCFANAGFIRFAIERQGYGKIKGEESVT